MKEDVGEKALIAVEEAKYFVVINNDEDLERANKLYKLLDTLKKNIKDKYDDVISKMYESWKFGIAKRDKYYVPADEQSKRLKQIIAEYLRVKEERRKAEEERLYKQAVAEEEERKKQEAEANPELAEEILAEPIIVAPVIIPKDIPSGGPVLRRVWGAEVTDFAALVKAVAEGKVSDLALEPNMKFLNAQAKSFKEKLQIAGVRAYSRTV